MCIHGLRGERRTRGGGSCSGGCCRDAGSGRTAHTSTGLDPGGHWELPGGSSVKAVASRLPRDVSSGPCLLLPPFSWCCIRDPVSLCRVLASEGVRAPAVLVLRTGPGAIRADSARPASSWGGLGALRRGDGSVLIPVVQNGAKALGHTR